MAAPLSVVAGGAGFIGSNLTRRLLDEGRRVVVVDDESREHAPGLFGAGATVRFVRHDLTKPLDLDLGEPIDEVLHLAAIVGVEVTERAPATVLRTNVLATFNMLDFARRHACGRFCLASTSEVYLETVRMGLAHLPTPEDIPLVIPERVLPRHAYAISKMASEACLWADAQQHGTIVRAVRYHNVYGPRMGERHVIPQFIRRALQRRDPFPINGAQRRAFCFIDDAAEATLRITRHPSREPLLVNIGNDREEVGILDLARRISAIAGYDPDFDVRDAPPASPERRRPDLGQMERLTGCRPRVRLDDGLRRTFNWYRAEGSASPSQP